MAATKSSGLNSPSMRAYRKLQKTKAQFCAGKITKQAVKAQASNYKKAAVKAGKKASEVDKTINRILKQGCSMSSNIAGRKRKKSSTTRRRRSKK